MAKIDGLGDNVDINKFYKKKFNIMFTKLTENWFTNFMYFLMFIFFTFSRLIGNYEASKIYLVNKIITPSLLSKCNYVQIQLHNKF